MTALKLTLADIVLAAALALAGAYLVAANRPAGAGEQVEIRAPGRPVEVLDLREARTIRVVGLAGETVIAIAGGRVAFASSACPNKVCVRRGEVWRRGEWIACVPNGVTAIVTGPKGEPAAGLEGGERGYDAITP